LILLISASLKGRITGMCPANFNISGMLSILWLLINKNSEFKCSKIYQFLPFDEQSLGINFCEWCNVGNVNNSIRLNQYNRPFTTAVNQVMTQFCSPWHLSSVLNSPYRQLKSWWRVQQILLQDDLGHFDLFVIKIYF
jgi:hypothetical protein